MKCPGCAADVYMTTRYGLYEIGWYRHHYCGDRKLPEPDVEQWDFCECGERYVRINSGPRLDMRTHELHVCAGVEPETEKPPTPEPPRRLAVVEPHQSPAKLRIL